MTEKPKKIGEQLRQAIEDTGLTGSRIAEDFGICQPTISRFLSGTRRNIRLDTVESLCEGLGLELRKIGS